MKYSIDKKVNLIFASLILLFGLLLCFYFIRHETRTLKTELIERTTVLINSLKTNSEYPILIGDQEAIAKLVKGVLTQKDVVFCRIEDIHGILLFEEGNRDEKFIREFTSIVVTKKVVEEDDEEMILGTQVETEEDIGKIYLTISLSGLHQKIRDIKKTTALFILVSIIFISIASTFMLSIILRKPVNGLVEGTKKIAEGDLGYKVTVKSNDEIGVLAASFNKMTEDLSRTLVSKNYVDNIIKSMVDSMIVTDSKGRIITVNRATLELLGYSGGELIGKSLEIILEKETFKTFDHFKLIEKVGAEKKYISKDGRKIPMLFSGSTMYDDAGKIQGIVCMAQDITERKKAEEELKRAKEAAEAANQAKSEFLANMSHEIRTPMNGIIGMTKIALDTSLSKQQHEYLTIVKNCADQLLGILNDILDFSKIEAGQLILENTNFDLRRTIENIADVVVNLAEEKNIELNFLIHNDLPGALKGDSARLKQILLNLVGNAIKFTEEGEIIVLVELESENDNSALLHFSVKDTGIGIPEERQKAIFESFTQADASTSRKFGGTGLGLTISRQLVKMMGGEIWLDSKPGFGSTFHFTGKFTIQQGKLPGEAVLPADLRGLKVLAVDDNATNRLILNEMLTSFKGLPLIVESGAEALEVLKREEDFELIISDFQMPEMDGGQLIRFIREMQPYKTTPIIILTSVGKNDYTTEVENLQKIWTITKPVKKSQMFDAMITALGTSFQSIKIKEERRLTEDFGDSLLKIDKKGRILLAEDNLVNQQVTLEFLKQVGLSADIAENGEDAVDALKKQIYDIVLMDVQMPVMDGFTATQKIREDLGMAEIPIIALTAHAMKGDQEKCFNAGMDDYLSKPIDPDELYRVLHKWIIKTSENK